MAGSVNRVILVGNLGKDPEIRASKSGEKIANLTLATSKSWKDRESGERKEKTQWHRVVVFDDRLAGVVERFVKKGSKIYVEGELETRSYQGQDGAERYVTEVVVSKFEGTITFLDSAPGAEGRSQNGGGDRRPSGGGAPTQSAGRQPAARKPPPGDLDDEIPF